MHRCDNHLSNRVSVCTKTANEMSEIGKAIVLLALQSKEVGDLFRPGIVADARKVNMISYIL